MYLGGNGLNCEVTFPDPATMIAHNGDNRKFGPKDTIRVSCAGGVMRFAKG